MGFLSTPQKILPVYPNNTSNTIVLIVFSAGF